MSLVCREQILEEVDNIAKANPHIMKVSMHDLHAYDAAPVILQSTRSEGARPNMCRWKTSNMEMRAQRILTVQT